MKFLKRRRIVSPIFNLSIRRKIWLSDLKIRVLNKKSRFEVTLRDKKIDI